MREIIFCILGFIIGMLIMSIVATDRMKEFKILANEQAYICADLGYNYSLGRRSKQELFYKLGSIIGKRNVSNKTP